LSINNKNLSNINYCLNSYPNTKLVIVTKNQSKEDVVKLLSKGFLEFGENRVQEANSKYDSEIRKKFKSINLHLIGTLQSKKTSSALQIFDSIQSIDRKKIIDTIADESKKLSFIRTKDFFIQVNIGRELQKSGCLPNETLSLYHYAKKLNLNIVGLMCIPPNNNTPDIYFKEMNMLRDSINKKLLLSMGMSNDFEIALNYNADYVRIGSKIFE